MSDWVDVETNDRILNDPRPWSALSHTNAIIRLIAHVKQLSKRLDEIRGRESACQGIEKRISDLEEKWGPDAYLDLMKRVWNLESSPVRTASEDIAARIPIAHSGDRVTSDGRVLVDGEYVAKLERIREAAKALIAKAEMCQWPALRGEVLPALIAAVKSEATR